MISDIDWTLFAAGLLAGSFAGVLFFGGLAWGMRLALRATRPLMKLLPSAAIRIVLLLAGGWWVATWGIAAVAGFASAFFALRLVLTIALRRATGTGLAR